MVLWNNVGGGVFTRKYGEADLPETSQGATARKAEEAVFDFEHCTLGVLVNENAALSSSKSSGVMDNWSSGDFAGDFVSLETGCDKAEGA